MPGKHKQVGHNYSALDAEGSGYVIIKHENDIKPPHCLLFGIVMIASAGDNFNDWTSVEVWFAMLL